MDILIYILAIYGLAFFIKESDGPWGLMGKLRAAALRDEYIGVYVYKLLDCYFCLGVQCGWIVCLLAEKSWHPNLLICWGLAGGVICLILDRVFVKLIDMTLVVPAPEPVKETKPRAKKSV